MDQSGSKLVYIGKQTKLRTVDPNTKYFNVYTQAPTIQTDAHSGEQTLKQTSANTTSYTHRRRRQAYGQRSGYKNKHQYPPVDPYIKRPKHPYPFIHVSMRTSTHAYIQASIHARVHTYMHIDYNKWPYTYRFTDGYKLIRVTCACPPATIGSGIPASTRSNIQTKIHRNEQTSQT